MSVLKSRVTQMVTDVMDTIKKSKKSGQRLAHITFEDPDPYIVTTALINTLNGLGYAAFAVLPGGDELLPCKRLYIDTKNNSVPKK